MTNSEALPEGALERLQRAAVGARDMHSISERLALTDSERAGLLGYLAAAFDYAEASPGPEPVGVGDFFVAMMEFDGRRYPPGLDALPDEMASGWRIAADGVAAPLARARLNDLCFEAGLGNRGERARAAIDGYLSAASELGDDEQTGETDHSTRDYTRLAALSRARLLARIVRDSALAERAIAAIVAMSDDLINGANPDPSLAILVVELLLAEPSHADEANRLLEAAKTALTGCPVDIERALRVQLRIAGIDEARRTSLRRDLIAAIASEGERMDGFARVHHYERAIAEARDAGQQDLVDDLTARMQAIDQAELELATHEFEIKLPRAEVDRWFERFMSLSSWQDALLALVSREPPSGRLDDNRNQAEQIAKNHPLLTLTTHVRVGGDGLPRFTPSTDEERRELQLTDLEMRNAQFLAVLILELLARIAEKWGPIEVEEMTEFFAASTHVNDEVAAALARDLKRVFAGDYEAAAYTGAAHLETVARELVLAAARPAYKVQRANAPGQYIGLGSLLVTLRKVGLDESWSRFLHGFAASPMGLNFRNELLHGFDLNPSETMVALLVVALVYLTRALSVSTRSGS